MRIARRLTLILFVVATSVGCDRVSKNYAASRLSDTQVLSFLADSVRLQLAYNEGAFLSLGSSLSSPWRVAIFRAGVGCLLLALLAYAVFFAPPRPWSVAAVSLVLGGGLSNLLDRLVYDGRVVDFISIGIGTLRTGVFNVADVAITAGVVMIFIGELRLRRNGF